MMNLEYYRPNPHSARLFWSLALAVSAGCATAGGPVTPIPEGDGAVVEAPEDLITFEQPALVQLSPSNLSIGETVQVFGERFLGPEYGTTKLVLDGTYTDENGGQHPYQGEFELTVSNPSLAEFEFDQLYFTAEDLIGTFQGTGKIVSTLAVAAENAAAGSELESPMVNTIVSVEPSILVTHLSTAEESCSSVTRETIAGTTLQLGLRAIGFGEASAEDPITFRIGFDTNTVDVYYVKDDVYTVWPPVENFLDPGVNDNVIHAAAPDGQNTMSFALTSGNSLWLNPNSRQTRATISPSVKIGQDYVSSVLLGRLAAGAIEGGPGPNQLNLLLRATRADGSSIERTATIEIHNEWEVMRSTQTWRLVERYPAEPPSGACGSCVAGGVIGSELRYSEGQSTSVSRGLSMRWDTNVANSVGLMGSLGNWNPWQIGVNAGTSWAETFGVDMNEQVSSETHTGLDHSAMILPTFYAICYRQLSRSEKDADVAYHNACGQSGIVGQITATDYGWGFDVATGPTCVPATNLPDPCVEEGCE